MDRWEVSTVLWGGERRKDFVKSATTPVAVGGKRLLRSVPDKRETTRPEPKWIKCSQVDSPPNLNKHQHLTSTLELGWGGQGRLVAL